MPISWNEIKTRAIEFSKEWENETREDAEAKSFWDGFFNVFGITRKRLAAFEEPVKLLKHKTGYIDLFWKGTLLVEHKSAGKDLDAAYTQALDYFDGILERDLPKYVLVSDFKHLRLYDLETKEQQEFLLKDFYKNVRLFGFIVGYKKQEYKSEDPVNIKAAEKMGALYDSIAESGYTGHELKVLLVRLLFCMFADDTSVFDVPGSFLRYLENRTSVDGSDLGLHLGIVFQVLNTPKEKRQKTLDEDLALLPYVNGGLFAESLPLPSFNSAMRERLLDACAFDWSRISPAIFGSMFQSVMDSVVRRSLGAHYTSETNIFKLIHPLFLDDLKAELDSCGKNVAKLNAFHEKLAKLKFLDPACGCGNFLIIAYRELRLLEIELLKRRYGVNPMLGFDITSLIRVRPEQFYGIEIEEFPARIAQTAIWLMDHQMNELASETFGRNFARLPLTDGAKIVIGNALTTDWETVVPKKDLSYILGNPPFIGSKLMTQEQRDELAALFPEDVGAGVLDYVCGWYAKAAHYVQGTTIRCAFVSTNSITQGEQVGILWKDLLHTYGIKIHFAHKTFKWSNEARGKAAVYCVIVGFAVFDSQNKKLYEYEDVKGEPHEVKVKNINPYLIDTVDLVVEKRSKPLCQVPSMSFGNMPLDGGHLLLSDDEKVELLQQDKQVTKFIKPLVSAKEFLNGENRWCLWLVDAKPEEIRQIPEIMTRVELVKEFRLASKAPSTQKFATTPALFRDKNNPNSTIAVPRVSSENRKYIPMGFFSKDYIVSDTCMSIPNGTLYHFGILESEMHMTWVRYVCGRLKSDYRYSKDIVYNNFPWPENPSAEKVKAVEQAAQGVLDARANHSGSSLADLYYPLIMPSDLVKAHQALDKTVDVAYGRRIFATSAERMEFLFELYEKYLKG